MDDVHCSTPYFPSYNVEVRLLSFTQRLLFTDNETLFHQTSKACWAMVMKSKDEIEGMDDNAPT